jgi:hypothetical protein
MVEPRRIVIEKPQNDKVVWICSEQRLLLAISFHEVDVKPKLINYAPTVLKFHPVQVASARRIRAENDNCADGRYDLVNLE